MTRPTAFLHAADATAEAIALTCHSGRLAEGASVIPVPQLLPGRVCVSKAGSHCSALPCRVTGPIAETIAGSALVHRQLGAAIRTMGNALRLPKRVRLAGLGARDKDDSTPIAACRGRRGIASLADVGGPTDGACLLYSYPSGMILAGTKRTFPRTEPPTLANIRRAVQNHLVTRRAGNWDSRSMFGHDCNHIMPERKMQCLLPR